MISIRPPDFTTAEVFDACIDGAHEDARKRRIHAARQTVLNNEIIYLSRAQPNHLDQIEVDFCPPELEDGKDLTWFYTNRFVPRGKGRELYNQILALALGGDCPLCGCRKASTVDHYLPKERYPVFSVTPSNLLPACRDCNTNKSSNSPGSPSELFIHPYFDEINDYRWLHAVVTNEGPSTLEFSINEVEAWDEEMQLRVAYHVKELKLVDEYLYQANRLLRNIISTLNRVHREAGAIGVKSHLLEAERSARENYLNNYRAVVCSAWANSDWFCDGGFSSIVNAP